MIKIRQDSTLMLRPGQAERIAHLFKRGYSLDLVSELGLINGWSREQAKLVLAEQGWALDSFGRLQLRFLKDAPVTGHPSVETADPERILNAGIDHERSEIRKLAQAAERAIERVRNALVMAERMDADTAAVAARQRAVDSVLGGIPLRGYPQAV